MAAADPFSAEAHVLGWTQNKEDPIVAAEIEVGLRLVPRATAWSEIQQKLAGKRGPGALLDAMLAPLRSAILACATTRPRAMDAETRRRCSESVTVGRAAWYAGPR